MRRIVICEKTTQAKDIHTALGNQYGDIYPCSGHLLELAEPEKVNPEWTWEKWDFEVLRPDANAYPDGLYPAIPTSSTQGNPREKLKRIGEALKAADEVIIATDCDREGQLIGESVLRYFKYRGRVFRAMFSAQDPKTLREAFAGIRPNTEYERLGQAAIARQQSDQIYNLTLTRCATKALKPAGTKGLIGIGRVKTATMAIVCIRELEIRAFKPQTYFQIIAICETNLEKFIMRYTPEPRILDRAIAEAIAKAADGFRGPLVVERKTKREAPPKLYDLPALQRVCSARFGWNADHTLAVAQSLYIDEGKKVITYPRSSVRYLSENDIANIPGVRDALATLPRYTSQPHVIAATASPQPRTGKAGHFWTPGLAGESHTAIIPNVNVMHQLQEIMGRLSDDEKQLFFIIADSYMCAIMPDFVYEQTTIRMNVPYNGQQLVFRANGRRPMEWGWRDLNRESDSHGNSAGEEDDDDGNDSSQILPRVQNGQPGHLSSVKPDAKVTKVPPRYTDGSLIEAMQEAWRFIPETSPWRERLKEAKGIGTPATRGEIIKGLKQQQLLVASGKHLSAPDRALQLYDILKNAAPALINPGTTAAWELQFDSILQGQQNYLVVIDNITKEAGRLMRNIVDYAKANGTMSGFAAAKPSGPTKNMVWAAQAIARDKGIPFPSTAKTDFAACKAFLDEHMNQRQEGARDTVKGRKTGDNQREPAQGNGKARPFVKGFRARKRPN